MNASVNPRSVDQARVSTPSEATFVGVRLGTTRTAGPVSPSTNARHQPCAVWELVWTWWVHISANVHQASSLRKELAWISTSARRVLDLARMGQLVGTPSARTSVWLYPRSSRFACRVTPAPGERASMSTGSISMPVSTWPDFRRSNLHR